jgi:hypothetical protein
MAKPTAPLSARYTVIDGVPTIRQVRNGKPIPYLCEIQPDVDALERQLRDFHAHHGQGVKDNWDAYKPPQSAEDVQATFDPADLPCGHCDDWSY